MEIKTIKIALSSICSYIYTLFNPSIPLLKALAIVMLIDLVVGLWQSFGEGKKFDPKKFLGKIKEAGVFIIVLFAAVSINELWQHYGIAKQYIADSFISAYGFYHFFSILQNAGKLGFPIASYFQRFIESKAKDIAELNKKGDTENENQK